MNIPDRQIVSPIGKGYSILKLRFTGDSNMATVTDDAPNPRAQPGEAATLTALIGYATGGTGSGAATLTLYQKLGDDPGDTYLLPRRRFPKFDTDNDDLIDWRIEEAEEHHWCMGPDDSWAPEWTNPDDGNMTWKLEFQFKIARRD